MLILFDEFNFVKGLSRMSAPKDRPLDPLGGDNPVTSITSYRANEKGNSSLSAILRGTRGRTPRPRGGGGRTRGAAALAKGSPGPGRADRRGPGSRARNRK